MGELMAAAGSDLPRTRTSLAEDLRRLGLGEGETVIVHSSLSSLGWVCGGAVAVVQALTDVVTPRGTLVMPAHSADWSDPRHWEAPPMPAAWWPIIREEMPAYDPLTTPSRGMGRIAETFRTWPGAVRSGHPKVSFSAWGREADGIVRDHALEDSMGEGSPLARLYERDARVLLLGVGHDSNTSFHLAEYRVNRAPRVEEGAPVTEGGRRVWKIYRDLEHETHLFPEIGAAFEAESAVVRGAVGSALARLFPQREAADFAVRWLRDTPC